MESRAASNQGANLGPSRRRTSSAQSPNRLGRAVRGAWRRLSPSREVVQPKYEEKNDAFPQDVKGPLGLNLLHSPPSPQIDFIFVHGLGGGSRKTWSLSPDPEHYWPKAWLPKEPDFDSVRVHSFGYNADWDNLAKSTMNILDFARSLIEDISHSPAIRKSNTKIVLIGHSMGGIIIKKAFMLAQEDHHQKLLASRFHTLYFLATPHSGSNMANVLVKIINVCYGSKAFVEELQPNSESIVLINDSFRRSVRNLKLLSFYENNPQILQRVLIVDKSSATIGFPDEICYPMDADHRSICKFQNANDPNYVKLRNFFSSTVDEILLTNAQAVSQVSKEELEQLVKLTGVSEVPDQELSMLEGRRVPGTCEWLLKKDVYLSWRDGDLSNLVFWLSGNPGFGKSVLSSSIINELQEKKFKCSYFFFKNKNQRKQTASDCLLSLAFQMTRSDSSIRRKVLEADLGTLPDFDGKTLWRKLFLGCILQTSITESHYWVIDAVDECGESNSLLEMLIDVPPYLKVLFTSRQEPAIETSISRASKKVHHYHIQEGDTVSDFSKFLDSSMDRVLVSYGAGKDKLKQRILEKATGSFLWVSLVIKRLEEAYSEEEAEDILSEVPTDMNNLYSSMLKSVQNRRPELPRSIFMWTLLSFRPLKIEGLQLALKMDKQTVQNLGQLIPAISGQLVCVNRKCEAEIVHQTARTYLLEQVDYPDLVLHKKACHTRIATLCLTLLAGSFSKGWQPLDRNAVDQNSASASLPDFIDYACEYFSEHLQRGSSEEDVNWELLRKFLDSNLLVWIDHLARKCRISSVTRTAKNLRAYFARRVKYLSPISPQKAIMETWIYDLFRVGAKFGSSLVLSPSSIYNLIPAMCPSESVFSRYLVSKLSRTGLSIRGLEESSWDDCLARMDYPKRQTSAVACGEQYFAVALSDGTIYLYSLESTQITATLNHGGRANILSFSCDDKYLASSGQRKVKIWDPADGIQLWTFDTSHQALTLHFARAEDILAATTQGNYAVSWDLLHGQEVGRWHWTESMRRSSTGKTSWPQPSKAIFSPNYLHLAVSYRGHPLYVFELPAHKFLGSFVRDATKSSTTGTSNHYAVDAMAFNPSLEINVLVVSYGDGELALYDLDSAQLRHRRVDVFAHSLKCSPDGRTLITGSSKGSLQIFEFAGARGDRLAPLYFIDSYDEGIRDIAFSSDSLRFADIRGSQCRIWEPAILDCKGPDGGSQSELSEAVSMESKSVGMLEVSSDPEITALCSISTGEFVFCGKKDGSVSYFETGNATQQNLLYQHAFGTRVTCIIFIEKFSILVSGDESGRVLINTIVVSRHDCQFVKLIAEIRSEEAISGILHDNSGQRLLLKGRRSAKIWTTEGLPVESTMLKDEGIGDEERIFVNHPSSNGHFLVVTEKSIQIFSWSNALEIQSSITSKPDITLRVTPPSPTLNRTFHIDAGPMSHLDEWEPPLMACLFNNDSTSRFQKRSILRIYSATSIVISGTSTPSIPLSRFSKHFNQIRQLIAVSGTTIFFLDMDLWICSLDVTNTLSIEHGARRHFFLLSEWQSTDGSFLIQYVATTREFLVARKHRILVISRGLDFEEPWIDCS